ncbi:MAG: inositol monophosphatase family protein [Henriciella sp.]|uniref:inositol monophosphatase family protein n=1 Tax=Henriciella sp. TaxID=1968823 RepID=UPI003C70C419
MQETEAGLSQRTQLLKEVAIEAGSLALAYFERGQTPSWEKYPGHPVTEADIESNKLIGSRLMAAHPDYGWLSEETSISKSTQLQDTIWCVDPIDGTRAFMSGQPYWCIGLAVIEYGQAVAGVVHAPVLGETYVAEVGKGAYLNGEPIHVSACRQEEGCRMIASESMLTHPAWRVPWPDMELARPKPNATLLRMCWVATGKWDATLALWRKSDWDLAAGTVIVREAGGAATTHMGEPFLFNRSEPAQRSLIAAGKALHPLLVERVKGVRLPDPNWTVRPYDKTEQTERRPMADMPEAKQLLHIVIGGELKDVSGVEFEDLSKIDFVGAFPSYKAAYDAWKNAAQRTVDNAEMRYFILHAHRLLDPETGSHHHV